MNKGLLLAAALLCSLCGTGWFALAMEAHWEQVKGAAAKARRGHVITLRMLGMAGLLGSLLLCLRADHGSMASLVWIMTLPASALVVAFALAWRPHWLRWLAWPVAWMTPTQHRPAR